MKRVSVRMVANPKFRTPIPQAEVLRHVDLEPSEFGTQPSYTGVMFATLG